MPDALTPDAQLLSPAEAGARVRDAIAAHMRAADPDGVQDRIRRILNRVGVGQFTANHDELVVTIDVRETDGLDPIIIEQARTEIRTLGYVVGLVHFTADDIDERGRVGISDREYPAEEQRGQVDFVTGTRVFVPGPDEESIEFDLDDPDLDGIAVLNEGHLDALREAAKAVPVVRLGSRTITQLARAAERGLDAAADPGVRERDLRGVVADLPQYLRVGLLDALAGMLRRGDAHSESRRPVVATLIEAVSTSFVEEPF